MFDDFRPFEVLKLLRDGDVTLEEFRYLAMTHYWGPVDQFWIPLIKLGFIGIDFEPKQEQFEHLQSLQVSLTELAGYGRRSLVVNPCFGKPVQSDDGAELFVVMPFREDLKEIYDPHIRAVADRLGKSVSRADDFFNATTVLSDVWSSIANAELLVADCTGRNASVFYEVGIAHTIGKPVILIAQQEEDIPFDVQQFRCILYEQTADGLRTLERSLERAIVATSPSPKLTDELATLRRGQS
jgi:hypothetical protein